MDHSSGSLGSNGVDDMGLSWSGVIKNERPLGNQVTFFWKGVPNEAKARELGYPYEDQELYVRIKSRDNLDVVEKKATEDLFKQYPEQYQTFRRLEKKVDGLALSSWPALNAVQVNNLKFAGIKTVEQLRDADPERLQKMGGEWMALQAQAISYFEAAKDGAFLVKQTKIIRELEAEREVFKNQIATMQAEIQAMRGQGGQSHSYLQPQYQPPQPIFDMNAIKAELMASLKAELVPEKKIHRGWPKGKPRGKKVSQVIEEGASNE